MKQGFEIPCGHLGGRQRDKLPWKPVGDSWRVIERFPGGVLGICFGRDGPV